MSKTLETKKKILNLLKKKDMTISSLSQELNLSTATVSQHMEELQQMGAVEKINNEHFKKLKYYKVKEMTNPMAAARYILGALAMVLVISLIYFYGVNGRNGSSIPYSVGVSQLSHSNTTIAQTSGNTGSNNTSTTISTGQSLGLGSCPMLFYMINGSINNYSGFSLYYLNTSNGTFEDYVISRNSSGQLYAVESVSNVLQEPSNFTASRQHYAFLTQMGPGYNTSSPGITIAVSPENFSIMNNEKLNLTLTITANSTANGTYWLEIDGPCGGGITPVLLTIGNGRYNGTVTHGGSVFA